jgi:hypothetical protein
VTVVAAFAAPETSVAAATITANVYFMANYPRALVPKRGLQEGFGAVSAMIAPVRKGLPPARENAVKIAS